MDIMKEFELAGVKREALTPEFQKVYDKMVEAHKEMQGDYTKKTSELAKEREAISVYEEKIKELEQEKEKLSEMNAKLDEANRAWAQFYEINFKEGELPPAESGGSGENGGKKGQIVGPGGESLVERDKIEKLEKTIDELKNALVSNKQEYDNKLGFTLQLLELARTKGDKFDMNEVIRVAQEKGYTDLFQAYDELHRNDIIEEKAKELAEKKYQELLNSRKMTDPSGGGSYPVETVLKAPSFSNDRDRTYELATEAALREIREAELRGE